MVVLADEVLESFFETDLSASFRLQPLPEMELPVSNSGLLGDLWSSIATDNNKKMFNMFTDEIGKTIGKHQVVHRPSIGRYTKLEEPKARESLLTPAMRHSSSASSLKTNMSMATSATAASAATATSGSLTVDVSLSPNNVQSPEPSASSSVFSPMPMVKAANAALMERTAFAIDDAKDDEDDSDDDIGGGVDDDQVMDEVRSICYKSLQVTDDCARWTRSWRRMIQVSPMRIRRWRKVRMHAFLPRGIYIVPADLLHAEPVK